MLRIHSQEERLPDFQDVSYGPHARNVLDVYCAPSHDPTPIFFFIHGGGFRQGDKSAIRRPLLHRLIERGISVVSTNYRLSQDAIYPAPFHDCRYAFQFVRYHAPSWGLDSTRIAVGGGSAGGGMSLWLAFRPDMADPSSDDPVRRQSTRPCCACVSESQISYDPRFIAPLIGGRAHLHPALPQLFGVPEDVWPDLDPEAARRVEDGAAINFLGPDAPPVFLTYSQSDRPVEIDDHPNFGIHHVRFGYELKRRMEELGLQCSVHQDETMGRDEEAAALADKKRVDFLARHLKAPAPSA